MSVIQSYGMTIEWCAKACHDEKFPYAGVSDGNQCFCGNEIHYAEERWVDNSQCNSKHPSYLLNLLPSDLNRGRCA